MTKYCLRIIDTSNSSDVEFFEDLMTRSMEDNGISIVKQESTWTKEGNYIIAIHWIEDIMASKDAEKIRDLIKSAGL